MPWNNFARRCSWLLVLVLLPTPALGQLLVPVSEIREIWANAHADAPVHADSASNFEDFNSTVSSMYDGDLGGGPDGHVESVAQQSSFISDTGIDGNSIVTVSSSNAPSGYPFFTPANSRLEVVFEVTRRAAFALSATVDTTLAAGQYPEPGSAVEFRRLPPNGFVIADLTECVSPPCSGVFEGTLAPGQYLLTAGGGPGSPPSSPGAAGVSASASWSVDLDLVPCAETTCPVPALPGSAIAAIALALLGSGSLCLRRSTAGKKKR